MKRYPVGRQDFSTIIEGNYVYVDKTELIHNLVSNYDFVFLSRPRRFGKSLLLSTLKYYFEGRKELFEGLKIDKIETQWKKHPVLYLSFANFDSSNPQSLLSILSQHFQEWEKKYNIRNEDLLPAQRFKNIIEGAYNATGSKVVILIDEYDQSIISTLSDSSLHEAHRTLLKSIYANLKEEDRYIKFAMMTGVSRFSNTSIFSGLNNLTDITFFDDFSSICGFTIEEIKQNLSEGISELGKRLGKNEEEILKILKDEYDGYHFSEQMIDIYNPFSLLSAINNKKISNYWFRTGTPSFLAQRLRSSLSPLRRIFNSEATELMLSETDSAQTDIIALLYQTGYLTLKSYSTEKQNFNLGIPNAEVRKSLYEYLLKNFGGEKDKLDSNDLGTMKRCLMNGNADEFLQRLQSFFSHVSYRLQSKAPEIYFENNLFLLIHAMGLDVISEKETSYGRIDLVVNAGNYIYVIEIKVDKSAEEAMSQINAKDYALPWKYSGKTIIKIGLNFSSEKRNIDNWVIDIFTNK